MTCIISLISLVMAVGVEKFSLNQWLLSWGTAWIVAFPIVLLLLPIVRKLAFLMVELPDKQN